MKDVMALSAQELYLKTLRLEIEVAEAEYQLVQAIKRSLRATPSIATLLSDSASTDCAPDPVSMGFEPDSASTDGCALDSASTDGCTPDSASTDGCTLDSASTDGCTLDSASTDGCTLDSASTKFELDSASNGYMSYLTSTKYVTSDSTSTLKFGFPRRGVG